MIPCSETVPTRLPRPFERWTENLPLLAAAVFAMLWAAARASVQSVTMDEADTFLKFAGRADPFQWFAAANNHILNTALIRVSTGIFGLSPFTLRLPALLGAAIYIGTAFYICAVLPAKLSLRLPLFLCLVYNPFVFDFLVAARGYGFASAFLLCAAAIPAVRIFRGADAARSCAICSACMAISFTANFSFAIADIAVFVAMIGWIWRGQGFSLRSLAWAVIPGLAVVIALPLPTLLGFPRTDLYDGASSLRQALSSVIHWSLYEVNPEVANPFMLRVLERIQHWLFPALGVAAAWRIVLAVKRRAGGWLVNLAAVLGGAMALLTVCHFLAFHLARLLYPFNRQTLFYVPLGTLCAGAVAAIPLEGRFGRASQCALVAVFWAFSIYFLGCMRLTYFGEWRYDADIKDVYARLADYNRGSCVEQAGTDWLYTSALNFYRRLSGKETFAEFQPGLPDAGRRGGLCAARKIRPGVYRFASPDDRLPRRIDRRSDRDSSGPGCRARRYFLSRSEMIDPAK